MLRGPVALLALFYVSAATMWVTGLTQGWTSLSGGEWIYVLVVALYASLSIAALRQRPDDARVRVFVGVQALNTLTIVWPVLDLSQTGMLLWFTLVGSSFVYALPFALYLHLASMIPGVHPFVARRRWFIPLNYALALAVGTFSLLIYADQIAAAAGAPLAWLPFHLDLDTTYRLDGLLNVGGYLYGGIGALLLLGTAAHRHRSQQAKRQALMVFGGLTPWTLFIAYSFGVVLLAPDRGATPDWELALEAATILVEAGRIQVFKGNYEEGGRLTDLALPPAERAERLDLVSEALITRAVAASPPRPPR